MTRYFLRISCTCNTSAQVAGQLNNNIVDWPSATDLLGTKMAQTVWSTVHEAEHGAMQNQRRVTALGTRLLSKLIGSGPGTGVLLCCWRVNCFALLGQYPLHSPLKLVGPSSDFSVALTRKNQPGIRTTGISQISAIQEPKTLSGKIAITSSTASLLRQSMVNTLYRKRLDAARELHLQIVRCAQGAR